MKKTRHAKMILTVSGSGSSTFRATIPTLWARDMNLSEEARRVRLIYDTDTKKITIENINDTIDINLVYNYMYNLSDRYRRDLTDKEMKTDEVIDNLIAVTMKEFKDEVENFDNIKEEDLREKIVKHIKKHQEDI